VFHFTAACSLLTFGNKVIAILTKKAYGLYSEGKFRYEGEKVGLFKVTFFSGLVHLLHLFVIISFVIPVVFNKLKE